MSHQAPQLLRIGCLTDVGVPHEMYDVPVEFDGLF